ncbi:hypothetical protein E8E13_003543 [Curvularia kusanoi]|uniref:NAD dependent epimerase/dehydratase n=1 Tax=Curvularia kusanoi TaxID=90978 RepID=A0A9P4T7X3_CURKU|nr:hypothetical protein E8E13_003543 [Curvularia kusanoi]
MATKDEPQMQVLVLGLPRTGTTSLNTALRRLGYNTYTTQHLFTKGGSTITTWIQFAETVQSQQQQQSIGTSSPLLNTPSATTTSTSTSSHTTRATTRSQTRPPTTPLPPSISSLLAGHTAIVDIPGCFFAPQLIAAYPQAKVILTTRSYSSWSRSMHDSLYALLTWHLFTLCRITGYSAMAPLTQLLHAMFGLHCGNVYGGPRAEEAFERHNQQVRDLVPRERLLEIDFEEEGERVGWDELCAFLGRPLPREGVVFPDGKEDDVMRRNIRAAWWGIARYLLIMVVLPGVLAVMAVVGWFWQEEVGGELERWVLRPVRGWAFGHE